MVSQVSTLSVMVTPMGNFTKICIPPRKRCGAPHNAICATMATDLLLLLLLLLLMLLPPLLLPLLLLLLLYVLLLLFDVVLHVAFLLLEL